MTAEFSVAAVARTAAIGPPQQDSAVQCWLRLRLQDLRSRHGETRPKIFGNLFHDCAARAREYKQVFRAFACRGEDHEIIRQEPRFARYHRAIKIDRLGKSAAAFPRHKDKLLRLLVR